MHTLFWYDLETYGTHPALDWPVQFAGLRTDLDLNIIGEPVNLFCKLPIDKLPDPYACVVTGLDPITINNNPEALNEPEFIRKILTHIAQPYTCTLGYNSIRFDDEFIRFSLYRNFYDPYAREWQNGNSRWDLLDVVRATYALRPEGIQWPMYDNVPSFKLEALTTVNKLEHKQAHNALSDVLATIAVAKLIKNKQPKLFDYFFQHKHKKACMQMIDFENLKPLVHISGKYSPKRSCCAIVVPICWHPIQSNKLVAYDLSLSPDQLIHSNPLEIKEWILTTSENLLKQGKNQSGIKLIHMNKCPILASVSVLRQEDYERLTIDQKLIHEHYQKVKYYQKQLHQLLTAVMGLMNANEMDDLDPELALYQGGFIDSEDRHLSNYVINKKTEDVMSQPIHFKDHRLNELFLRYKGRYFPSYLTSEEYHNWEKQCMHRLNNQDSFFLTYNEFFYKLEQLKSKAEINQNLLEKLENYGHLIQKRFNLNLHEF